MTFTGKNRRILSRVHQHSCRHDVLKVKASCCDVNKHLASLYPDRTRIELTKVQIFFLCHFLRQTVDRLA